MQLISGDCLCSARSHVRERSWATAGEALLKESGPPQAKPCEALQPRRTRPHLNTGEAKDSNGFSLTRIYDAVCFSSGFSHFHIRVFDPHLELLDMLLRCLQACARRGQYLARAALPAIGRGHVDVRDVLGQQGCLLQARLHPRSWNRYLEGRRRFDLPQQGLAVRKDGLEIIARLDHFFYGLP